MAYTKTVWTNDTTPDIDAEHLNKIENELSKLDLDGLIYQGSLTSANNIDTFVDNGAYYCPLHQVSGTLPSNLSTSQGTIGLLMIMGKNNIKWQYLIQTATGKTYTRTKQTASGWTSWQGISLLNLDGLIYQRSLSNENLDTFIENGCYFCPLNTIQGTLPENLQTTLGTNGLLMVMGKNYLKWQYLIQLSTGYIYTRTEQASNSWTTWTDFNTDVSVLKTRVDTIDNEINLENTRNVWPFEKDYTFTDSKTFGHKGTDVLPAGRYTMSFDVNAENTINWWAYGDSGQLGSGSCDPASGKCTLAFTAGEPMQRIAFGSSGTVEMSNIQIEILDWEGYEGSTVLLRPLNYANNYINTDTLDDLVAREYPSNWVGKKIIYNGDSITQATGTGYVKVVNQLLRFGNVRNYAIGGTRLAHIEGMILAMVDRYQDMDTDADVVFIMANTNDYASQVPLGDADSTDPTTYNGALNIIFNWLKENYKTQPIIISTPLTRKINYRDGEPLPITIEQYAQCVRDRVADYHFILYDAYNLSGMDLRTSPRDGTGITDDGLHPNLAGEIALGRKIAAFINSQ